LDSVSEIQRGFFWVQKAQKNPDQREIEQMLNILGGHQNRKGKRGKTAE